EVTRSAEAEEEATSIAVSCQTAPFVPLRRPTKKQSIPTSSPGPSASTCRCGSGSAGGGWGGGGAGGPEQGDTLLLRVVRPCRPRQPQTPWWLTTIPPQLPCRSSLAIRFGP